ncbi:unnamed protein product [Gongylonema pulchrum]|uniref:NYN domain-containing protein n=1 Tax=Gongylonema pulchrum TaxID=637853 RepID=A0A183D0A9_9BILA|nr:unnamed protein product [Gongylonema pulchrum]
MNFAVVADSYNVSRSARLYLHGENWDTIAANVLAIKRSRKIVPYFCVLRASTNGISVTVQSVCALDYNYKDFDRRFSQPNETNYVGLKSRYPSLTTLIDEYMDAYREQDRKFRSGEISLDAWLSVERTSEERRKLARAFQAKANIAHVHFDWASENFLLD